MSKETKVNIFWIIIFLVIAAISFFGVSRWATSVDTYSKIIESLDDLQKKALGMTTAAAGLATGAAAIPGETLTPIANKLVDVAGYMVIVYVAIILEKYLLTLTGFVAFKVLIPIGGILAAGSRIMRGELARTVAVKLSSKCMVLGLLLWILVPISVEATNFINNTYQDAANIETELSEVTKEDSSEESNESSAKDNKNFSIKDTISDLFNTVEENVKEAGKVVGTKVEELKDILNRMIEGVAVMIVTTCVIPLCVLVLFLWIFKTVTSINIPIPTTKQLPKASVFLGRGKESE
ncbi:MAG: hypothetical protein ACI39H_04350 [Lachnospiraceae bacterium]